MSELAKKYEKDGLVILAVNAWDEDKAILQKFAKDNQLRQRILLNGNGVAKEWGITSVPVVVWIDRDGVIRDVEAGGGGPEGLEKRTKALIAG